VLKAPCFSLMRNARSGPGAGAAGAGARAETPPGVWCMGPHGAAWGTWGRMGPHRAGVWGRVGLLGMGPVQKNNPGKKGKGTRPKARGRLLFAALALG
jgi:hypothetical protein